MRINYDIGAKSVLLEVTKEDGLEKIIWLPEKARIKLTYDFGLLPHASLSISPVDSELFKELKEVARCCGAKFSQSTLGGQTTVKLCYGEIYRKV